jgi:hypothetical protein
MGLFLLLTLRGVGLDGKRHGKAAAADDVVADDAPAADDGA